MSPRPWPQLQAELALALTRATYGAVVEPLHGEWRDGLLHLSGPSHALVRAEFFLRPAIERLAAAGAVFVHPA